ncbi:uncharacterized protein [Chelonus insularis]|uniref:uncharacterized protein n=1 Tax=Chelonus insularis TaxID=460826 RepID=UPI00158BEB2D|nr:uncharacterized protein LOC118064625 [Chelonus insularis]
MALNYINQIRSIIFQSINRNSLRNTSRINRCTFKTKSQTDVDDEENEDQPIKYSTSPAAQWAARYSQAGANTDDEPWYQPHIVIWSTVSVLVYFGLFREPNDLDEAFDRELGDYFPQLTEEELEKKFGKHFVGKE